MAALRRATDCAIQGRHRASRPRARRPLRRVPQRDFEIVGEHETHVLRGAHRIVNPYPARIRLVRHGTDWLETHSAAGIRNSHFTHSLMSDVAPEPHAPDLPRTRYRRNQRHDRFHPEDRRRRRGRRSPGTSPGKSMNVLSASRVGASWTRWWTRRLPTIPVKGIVITSGKEGSFAAGMDLNIIAKMKDSAGDEPAKRPDGRADEVCHAHPAQDRARRAWIDKTLKGGKPIACGPARYGTRHRPRDPAGLPPHLLPPTTPRPRSVCRKSWSAFSPAWAARRGWSRKMGAMAASPPSAGEGKLSDPKPRRRWQPVLIDEVVDDPVAAATAAWVLQASRRMPTS